MGFVECGTWERVMRGCWGFREWVESSGFLVLNLGWGRASLLARLVLRRFDGCLWASGFLVGIIFFVNFFRNEE